MLWTLRVFEETKEMDTEKKFTVCRLCLRPGDVLVDVFEHQGAYTTADIITELLQFEVSVGDVYPQCVCGECLEKLLDFRKFKECCNTSKALLDKAYAAKLVHVTETNPYPVILNPIAVCEPEEILPDNEVHNYMAATNNGYDYSKVKIDDDNYTTPLVEEPEMITPDDPLDIEDDERRSCYTGEETILPDAVRLRPSGNPSGGPKRCDSRQFSSEAAEPGGEQSGNLKLSSSQSCTKTNLIRSPEICKAAVQRCPDPDKYMHNLPPRSSVSAVSKEDQESVLQGAASSKDSSPSTSRAVQSMSILKTQAAVKHLIKQPINQVTNKATPKTTVVLRSRGSQNDASHSKSKKGEPSGSLTGTTLAIPLATSQAQPKSVNVVSPTPSESEERKMVKTTEAVRSTAKGFIELKTSGSISEKSEEASITGVDDSRQQTEPIPVDSSKESDNMEGIEDDDSSSSVNYSDMDSESSDSSFDDRVTCSGRKKLVGNPSGGPKRCDSRQFSSEAAEPGGEQSGNLKLSSSQSCTKTNLIRSPEICKAAVQRCPDPDKYMHNLPPRSSVSAVSKEDQESVLQGAASSKDSSPSTSRAVQSMSILKTQAAVKHLIKQPINQVTNKATPKTTVVLRSRGSQNDASHSKSKKGEPSGSLTGTTLAIPLATSQAQPKSVNVVSPTPSESEERKDSSKESDNMEGIEDDDSSSSVNYSDMDSESSDSSFDDRVTCSGRKKLVGNPSGGPKRCDSRQFLSEAAEPGGEQSGNLKLSSSQSYTKINLMRSYEICKAAVQRSPDPDKYILKLPPPSSVSAVSKKDKKSVLQGAANSKDASPSTTNKNSLTSATSNIKESNEVAVNLGFINAGYFEALKGLKTLKCPVCGKMYGSARCFKVHVDIHKYGKTFKCETCGKRYGTKWRLSEHMETHKTERNFICDLCGKCYKTQYLLTHHKLLHGEKNYICDECGKRFFTKSKLISHQGYHNKEKIYACEICGKRYHHKSILNSHSRVHRGVRDHKHKCSLCGKGFHTPAALKVHMRRHTGERPFKCSVCEKRFITKSLLESHFNCHTRDKTFKCDICNAVLSNITALYRHRKRHDGKKYYKCDVCGKEYTQSHNLKNHKKKHQKI